METIAIRTRPRTQTGKSYARKIRNDGWIPATYYGHGREPRSIEVDYRNMLSLIQNKKEMHILDLGLEDETESQAIIKDIQTDVLRSEKILHVDFQHVSMKEKVSVTCPLHIEGTPIGVSRDGGMLQHSADSLSIECLPGDIPEYISVDVSKLEVGDTVHVRDLHEENIEITSSPDEIIASVTVPKREPTAEELAEQEAEEGAETPSDEQSEESGGQQQEQSE